MVEPLVVVKDLFFAHADRVILDHINLNVEKGKITAIMGPSGSGKTTLLKLMSAQLKPISGNVCFDGIQNIHNLSTKALYECRRRMGMLFQAGGLFTNLNVFENVAFPLREHTRLSEEMIRDLVYMKLEAVGLRGARELMPSELSGGMAHRVAMARALALDPEFMMYDEPFTGQDPITMGVLVSLIKKLNNALGLTSVIVSHDVQETASIADYIYLILDGKIVGQGSPSELFADQLPAIQQFLKGLPDGVVPYKYPSLQLEKDFELC